MKRDMGGAAGIFGAWYDEDCDIADEQCSHIFPVFPFIYLGVHLSKLLPMLLLLHFYV